MRWLVLVVCSLTIIGVAYLLLIDLRTIMGVSSGEHIAGWRWRISAEAGIILFALWIIRSTLRDPIKDWEDQR